MGNMRAFACPICDKYTSFESQHCSNCLAELGFDLANKSMFALSSGIAVVDDRPMVRCTKAADLGCNWLVWQDQVGAGRRGRCLADSLIRREPDADDTIAVEKLVPTAIALRRLVYQLIHLGVAITPHWQKDGGLAFD